jgi:hypothetical protein
MAIGDQAGEQMDEEVERTAVARVLDLADILELIDDGLDEGALAQEQAIGEGHKNVAHILAQFGDEPQPVAKEQLLSKRRRDVALVPKEASKESSGHARNGTTVICIPRGEAEGQQLAAIIHD